MIAILIFLALSGFASFLVVCASMLSSQISATESPLESHVQEKETSFALEIAGDLAS